MTLLGQACLCLGEEPGLTFILMRACVLSHFSRVRLFATPWTIAHQSPLFMGFSRQEYRSGLSFPPPGDLPDPGIEPASLISPALVLMGRLNAPGKQGPHPVCPRGSSLAPKFQILSWPKSSFKFFIRCYGKLKQTFWSTQ